MRVNGWLDYLGGIVTVKIRGIYPEKLINLALSRGIYLSGVKRDGADIVFSLRRNGFKPLQSMAEQLDYEIEITGRQGLPFYRRLLSERWMLLGGALIFLLALYTLTSLVWFLDVVGTSQVKPQTILTSATRHGLHKWSWKNQIDKNQVEAGILKDVPMLSYVEVNVQGITVSIKVVEKILPDESLMGPCNVVALSGGVIEEILVLEGKGLVTKGDTVEVGDILISGLVTSLTDQVPEQTEDVPPPEPRLVRARGVVKARVLYEGYGEQPMEIRTRVFTGREEGKIIVQGPWGNLILNKPDQRFSTYTLRTRRHQVATPWGIWGWTSRTWLETRDTFKSYDQDWALEKAKENAIANLKSDLNNSEKVL
ncbi:MAG: sporulation protein YqfD, partial [Ignavibacteriales bacterium]